MPIRKLLFVCISIVFCVSLRAQQSAYQVSFTDKQGSPSISNPSVFLSARALARRAAQGIKVDSTDVPVSPVYIDSALAITGGVLHVKSKWLNTCVILVTDTTTVAGLLMKPYIKDVKLVGY